MSKATNQTLLLLTMSWGSLQLIDMEGHAGDDIKHTIGWALECNEQLIHTYPYTGNLEKAKVWVKEQMRTWRDIGDSMDEWNPLALATLSLNICEDLIAKIKNRFVRDKIEVLRDAVEQVSYHFTKKGKDEFTYLEESNVLLREMYGIIGFEQ